MKVATVSTLWDYINRAMPWNAPKSLKPDEVYAVTAYLLNLGGIVPADFTLSDKNIAEVQKRMPNRNGMTTDHAMWPGNEFGAGKVKPDVQAKACMSHCEVPQDVTSRLPAHADNATATCRAEPPGGAAARRRHRRCRQERGRQAVRGRPAGRRRGPDAKERLHGLPRHDDQAGRPGLPKWPKYAGQADYLAGKIVSGGGVWGNVPMPRKPCRRRRQGHRRLAGRGGQGPVTEPGHGGNPAWNARTSVNINSIV
jgi:cytochrome c